MDKVSNLFSGAAAEAAIFRDEYLVAADPTDTSKRVRLDAGGITTSTTRVLTAQDKDGTIATTTDTISTQYGGTGQDFSATSGLVKLSSGTASAVTAPSGDIVGTSDTQTLTNKTISGSSNTLSNIAKASITGAPTGDFVGTSDTQTLTNKTIDASSNTLSNIGNASLSNSAITVTDGITSTNVSLGGTVTFSGTSNEVEVGESSGTITIGLPNDVTIGNDLVVTNNLTVSGTTTTLNTETLTVEDKNIELAVPTSGSPTDAGANNGGITLKGSTDHTIIWDSANTNWTLSEHVNIPTGKEYKINNVKVLDSSSLGSGVTSSSLTSVGTIGTGTWQGTAIGITYGGTGQTTAQAAINALTQVSGATPEYVLTKDTSTGDATWKAASTVAAVNDLTDVTITGAAKGDILVYNGSAWVDLTVGSDGQVLKAASGEATGLEWGAGGGGATATHAFTNQSSTSYRGTGSSGTGIDVGTAVATEASGVGEREIYIRKIDANNEGVFTVIHKNGSAVEVQIA